MRERARAQASVRDVGEGGWTGTISATIRGALPEVPAQPGNPGEEERWALIVGPWWRCRWNDVVTEEVCLSLSFLVCSCSSPSSAWNNPWLASTLLAMADGERGTPPLNDIPDQQKSSHDQCAATQGRLPRRWGNALFPAGSPQVRRLHRCFRDPRPEAKRKSCQVAR